jgi:hypothetical protein
MCNDGDARSRCTIRRFDERTRANNQIGKVLAAG